MSTAAFQMPKEVTIEKMDDFHGVFMFEPLEKGYGVTIGNALRRVLLSSLEGYAITAIKVSGVRHEFSTIKGVVEDMVEIVLNLKKIRLKQLKNEPEGKIIIPVKKKKVLKAGDIAKVTPSFKVLNPNLTICHLDDTADFELELFVEKGRGYVPSEESTGDDGVVGLLPIDAIFTPVKNVKYSVENMRVGQRTDYERLVLDLETDGSIDPESALKDAASTLIKHFILFTNTDIVERSFDDEEEELVDEETLRVRKALKTPLADLNLSVRAFNCLKAAKIKILGDLVKYEMKEMMKFRNFGKRSLEELEELLGEKKLTFGMNLTKYKLDE